MDRLYLSIFAVGNLAINAMALKIGLKRSRFSALFWLSLLLIFSLPALVDTIAGLPHGYAADRYYMAFPHAVDGLAGGVRFAFVYSSIVCATYVAFEHCLGMARRPSSNRNGRLLIWMTRSDTLITMLALSFVVSIGCIAARHWDLSHPFNEFLAWDATPEYETYFFLASTPLIALLVQRKPRQTGWIILVCGMSAVAAYFLGVRYYMFPFIGYAVWFSLNHPAIRLGTKFRRIGLACLGAWVVLTLWGVIRAANARDNPWAELSGAGVGEITEKILLGNEFGTRLAYYDLAWRLESGIIESRGIESLKALFLSPIYPMLQRYLNIVVPISNSKRVFELQNGVLGKGASTGVLVFGNDWFTFGKWGVIIGAVVMGTILFFVDRLQSRGGTLWFLLGPMWTFQLIFFARGGTDVWLAIWGMFLPITLAILIAARLIDRGRPLRTLSRLPQGMTPNPEGRRVAFVIHGDAGSGIESGKLLSSRAFVQGEHG